MRIDVYQPERRVPAQRLEYRVGDRVIAADGQRTHSLLLECQIVALDVLERLLQTVAAAKRHVADIRGAHASGGNATRRRVVWPDALDGAYRARPEARAAAVGYPKIHRHADHRNVEAGGARGVRQAQERGHAGVRQATLAIG